MMSDDTGDGNWFPLTTTVRWRGGGSSLCRKGLACVSSNQRVFAHRRENRRIE